MIEPPSYFLVEEKQEKQLNFLELERYNLALKADTNQQTAITARELDAQVGSSPGVNTSASPPSAGTRQIWKSRISEVNTIHFPSGDQSGSVGLGAPVVRKRRAVPPEAETV